jgi:hypothetical protein
LGDAAPPRFPDRENNEKAKARKQLTSEDFAAHDLDTKLRRVGLSNLATIRSIPAARLRPIAA